MRFAAAREKASVGIEALSLGTAMAYSLAQWTGVAVTSIVVLGSDMDVMYAIPLGLFAGALATFFSALGERALDTPFRYARLKTRLRAWWLRET